MTDPTPCRYPLRITPGDLHGDIRCPRCGSTWTAQRLLLVALSDPRVTIWAYPTDVADALGIPGSTLRRWRAEERIAVRGSQLDAGAAYRLRHAAVT